MGAFTDLIHQCSGIVTRKVDRALWDWIWAISQLADNLSGATQQQVRYVNKGGNDATGDGSFDNPFLTIQAAITSVTDAAAAKPYVIAVAPGIYATNFVLQPWMFVVGAGRNSTVLVNASANWIGAGFAAAGAQDTGIIACTLRTSPLLLDFAAVVSPAGRFFLYDALLDGVAWTVTGSLNTQQFVAENIQQLGSGVLTASVTNCPTALSGIEFVNTNLNLTNTAAFIMVARLGMISSGRPLTLTCNDTANFLSVVGHYWSTISAYLVVVGSGVTVLSRGLVQHAILADADATLNFTTPLVAGAIVGANEGENMYSMAPTAARTLTINDANPSTRLRIVNTSTAFFITLAGPAVAGGQQTYVPPGGVFDAWRDAGVWRILPVVQSGSVTLTNGASVLIPADITANARIVAFLKDINGSASTGPVAVAKPGDRVVGTRAGGGGFKVTGTSAAGVTNAADQGIYDWHVTNA